MVPEPTAYACVRERRRIRVLSLFCVALVCAWMVCTFWVTPTGVVGRWLDAAKFVFAAGYVAVALMLAVPLSPDRLVTPRQTLVGVWRASMPGRQVPGIHERRPSVGNREFPGTVTFGADGTVVWHLSGRRNVRRYGDIALRWDTPPCTVTARRIPGVWWLVHVAIYTGPDPQRDVNDMWLRRARTFPI